MTELLTKLFIKNRDDIQSPAARAAYGKMAGITGIVCNILLFIGKLVVGLLSGSISVTADAVNNLTDASSSVVTLVGFRLAEKPADEDHPYGHARIEYIAGLVITALILVIGFELAKSSVTKILNPEQTVFSWITVAVLAASILVKLWMAAFKRKLGKKISSETLLAAAADSRNDVISTLAVLVSCIVSYFAHIELDGFIGLAVALFILYSGVGIAKDTIDPLLGKAPDPELVRHISEKICGYENVLGIHDLIVHDYGPGRRFASVHVELDRNLDVLVGHDLLDNIERDFAAQEHLQLVIHYDPIVTDDEELNEAKEQVLKILADISDELSMHDFRMVPGKSHTNVLFDLVLPFSMEEKAAEIKKTVSAEIRKRHPNYFAVIQIDYAAFNRH